MCRYLKEAGKVVNCPRRGELPAGDLGHVVYAIGLTADFRSRPFDTVEAHVGWLSQVLQSCTFQSFIYLSSTRVYLGASAATEETPLVIRPQDPHDLYNLSKLLGERLVLDHAPNGTVLRLSNVYGPDFTSVNFLTSVLREACQFGTVTLGQHRSSAKDYVSIDDVCRVIADAPRSAKRPLYNVASGINTTHGDILQSIERETGAVVTMADDAPVVSFPVIDRQRLLNDFAFAPRSLIDDLPGLIQLARTHFAA